MKKIDFNAALSTLMELAISQGNSVTKEQIEVLFDDILEDKKQYTHIYEYLNGRHITVSNNAETTDAKACDSLKVQTTKGKNNTSSVDKASLEPSTEDKFFMMYSKEVAKIRSQKQEYIDILLKRHMEGDKSARNDLVLQYLPMVMTISEQFSGQGVRRSDLIQEGNLGLIEGIEAYNGSIDFKSHIISHISNAMQKLVDLETGSAHIANHLVERVNALSDATEALAEKYGRQATLEELCEFLSLSEDEVRTIMKISLDALTIEEDNINP